MYIALSQQCKNTWKTPLTESIIGVRCPTLFMLPSLMLTLHKLHSWFSFTHRVVVHPHIYQTLYCLNCSTLALPLQPYNTNWPHTQFALVLNSIGNVATALSVCMFQARKLTHAGLILWCLDELNSLAKITFDTDISSSACSLSHKHHIHSL